MDVLYKTYGLNTVGLLILLMFLSGKILTEPMLQGYLILSRI
jgi:hypothetical protein